MFTVVACTRSNLSVRQPIELSLLRLTLVRPGDRAHFPGVIDRNFVAWSVWSSWNPTTSTWCWSSSWFAHTMRVVPTARLPPGGVWLLPSTLNELTVKFAGCGPAVLTADAAGWTVVAAIRPVRTVAASAAITEDAFFNFSPIAKSTRARRIAAHARLVR